MNDWLDNLDTSYEKTPEFKARRAARLAREARFAAEHPDRSVGIRPAGGRRCTKCHTLLSSFIDWDSRNEHSIECYDRALPVPQRYG